MRRSHEREGMDLRRYYFISQIEHAQNIIFKRNHPIHSIFERSCDLGLARITTDRIANIFGWRITKRTQGKAQVVLDQMDHGHHVLRLPLSRQGFRIQRSVFRQDQGQGTRFSFQNPEPLSAELCGAGAAAVNDRFADAQAENLNVEIDYPLLESLASPCRLKSQRMAGIRLENDRIIRLLEILMHSAGHIGGMNAADIHRAVLQAYQLTSEQYTRNQLAYDLRKLKAHGLIERPDNRYVYVLSDYRRNAAGCSGVQRSVFRVKTHRAPDSPHRPWSFLNPEH